MVYFVISQNISSTPLPVLEGREEKKRKEGEKWLCKVEEVEKGKRRLRKEENKSKLDERKRNTEREGKGKRENEPKLDIESMAKTRIKISRERIKESLMALYSSCPVKEEREREKEKERWKEGKKEKRKKEKKRQNKK